MRILFVAMSDSIHTARWINQIANQPWDIHLFPSKDANIHPALSHITLHDINYLRSGPFIRNVYTDNKVRIGGAREWPLIHGAGTANRVWRLWEKVASESSALSPIDRLVHLIRILKPDIVHSLEMQHAGYLTLEARERFGEQFPTWVMSIWGSDLYLFGRLKEHIEKIKSVLSACDYFACECNRDEILARSFGFKGEFLTRLPMWGGLNTHYMNQFRQPGPTSSRRLIILKGYQGWAGRAFVGLRAIELCAHALKGYRVAVYVADEDVRIVAELVSQTTGIPIEIIPPSPHEAMLRLHGLARISIGLSISDGLPASMIEAMVMGSFPIQSCTACADEWIKDGETGLIVPPEDPEPIAAAIRRAVSDDELVDYAAKFNIQTIQERLDYRAIQQKVIAMYEKMTAKSS